MKVTERPINSAGLESTKENGKPQKSGAGIDGAAPSRQGSATVEISDNAKLMAQAKALAMKAPDIRGDKVASLKKSIRDGAYKVDSGGLADKILQDHFDGDFGKNRI